MSTWSNNIDKDYDDDDDNNNSNNNNNNNNNNNSDNNNNQNNFFLFKFSIFIKKLQHKCYNQKTYKNFLYNKHKIKHLKVKIKAK